MIYKKYRELTIDLFSIQYRNMKLKKIISYPPAGNDVVEAIVDIKNKEENVYKNLKEVKWRILKPNTNI